jgi:hypothetical protein
MRTKKHNIMKNTYELLLLVIDVDLYGWTSLLVDNSEWPTNGISTYNAEVMTNVPMRSILLNFLVIEFSADQPLKGKDSIRSIDDSLSFGRQTNQTFPMLCECDNGRCCPGTLRILNYTGCFALHD